MQPSLREDTLIPDPDFPVNVFHVRQPFGNVIPPHWHAYAEWILVRSGRFRVQVDAGSAELGPGNAVFVVPGCLHSAFPAGGRCEITAIVFDETLVRSAALDGAELGCSLPLLRGDLALPFTLGPDEEAAGKVKAALLRVEAELEAQRSGYELFVKASLMESLAELYRAASNAVEGRPLTHAGRAQPMAALLRRLCLEYMEPISVEEAARECGLSRSHFCHAFKKATGKTFLEYLHTLRIIEAERLLADTDQPVQAIANAVGFQDPAYFSRVYRALRGESPRSARFRARQGSVNTGV
jgi:AraC-like DNA-binding protein/mannose-6-phosphate isomerase-like protein (cupin superfamily)